jgi:hypothetical protein
VCTCLYGCVNYIITIQIKIAREQRITKKSAAIDKHGTGYNTANVVPKIGDNRFTPKFQSRKFMRRFRGESVFLCQAKEEKF